MNFLAIFPEKKKTCPTKQVYPATWTRIESCFPRRLAGPDQHHCVNPPGVLFSEVKPVTLKR